MKRYLISLSFAFVIIFILIYTFYFFTNLFLLYESDAAFPGFLLYGIKEYGWKFLPSVIYTHANWILSLMPFYFTLFSIFKPSLLLIFILGWFIFILNAFLSGLLLKKVLDIPFKSNLILFSIIVFLFIDYINITAYGFYYPVTHNSTFTWVLLALLTTIYLIESENFRTRKYLLCLILISIIVAIAGFSDAWFHAVYSLPAIISLLLVALTSYRNKNLVLKLNLIIIPIITGWLISYTKFFGLLGFVPNPYFKIVESLEKFESNLFIYIFSISSYFGILQGFKINEYVGFFILFIFLLIVFGLPFLILKNLEFLRQNNQNFYLKLIFLIIFFVLSMVVISSSFILYELVADIASGRYLINIFYFGFSLIIILIYLIQKKIDGINKLFKYLIYTFMFSYLSVIFIDNYTFFVKPNKNYILQEIEKDIDMGLFKINNKYRDWIIENIKYNTKVLQNFFLKGEYLKELLSILKQENLRVGYGFYWEAYTHIITIISEGNIKIGAISEDFNIRAQTSTFLFRNSKIKDNTNFLVIPKFNLYISSTHVNYYKTIKLARLFFGKPAKVIESKNYKVLIWNYKIYPARPKIMIGYLIRNTRKYLLDGNKLENLSFKSLIEKNYVEKLLGYNSDDPRWSKVGNVWVGEWDCSQIKNKCVGIGIVDFIDNLEEVIKIYKDKAVKIYFPYPELYKERKATKEYGELLLVFKVSDLLNYSTSSQP